MSQSKVRLLLILGHLFLTTLVATNFSAVAQNQTSESNEQVDESIGERKPIRPIQNANFYPDEDDDAGKDKCLVGEFRLIALNTTDPGQRKKIAEAWIKDQAKFCTIAKLLSIRNNRARWLGTADSITIDAELDMQLEIALEKNDETFAALYGLKLPPPPPVDEEVQ